MRKEVCVQQPQVRTAQHDAPRRARSYLARASGSDSVVYATLMVRKRSVASACAAAQQRPRQHSITHDARTGTRDASSAAAHRFVHVRMVLQRQLAVRALHSLGCAAAGAGAGSSVRHAHAQQNGP
jgi:hypothetical protein